MRRSIRRATFSLGYIPSGPYIPPIHSLPREYVSALKATYPHRSYYGAPDYTCTHCSAVFWYQERVQSQSSSSGHRIAYNLCCRQGKIALPTYRDFPPLLRDLICFNGTTRSNTFMRLIRQYNSLFAFTSLGVNIDTAINTGVGPYVFRINGVVHHRIGSLLPPVGRRPEYAQLYIYDTNNELNNRLNLFQYDGPYHDQPDPSTYTYARHTQPFG